MPLPRILWVDDEEAVLAGFASSLRSRYEIVGLTSARAGLERLANDPAIVVIVSDLQMPEMDGLVLLAEVRALRPDVIRVMMTGNAERAETIAADHTDLVFAVLTKPCSRDLLIETLDRAIASRA